MTALYVLSRDLDHRPVPVGLSRGSGLPELDVGLLRELLGDVGGELDCVPTERRHELVDAVWSARETEAWSELGELHRHRQRCVELHPLVGEQRTQGVEQTNGALHGAGRKGDGLVQSRIIHEATVATAGGGV